MTLVDVAPVTIPTKQNPDDRWRPGDIVTVDGVRWKLRAISAKGKVVASSMNTSNADIWWETTLDHLPTKGA